MKIGLISDTHGYLDQQIFHYFANCDQIWHAGDIGNITVADRLAAFKPLRAVHGNIDGPAVRRQYPENQRFVCAGIHVWLTHIAGKPNVYTPSIRKGLQEQPPTILVCGHTHILRVMHDTKNRFLYLNPGAAGLYGIHTVRTLLRFDIKDQKLCNMEAIELGNNTNL